MDLGLGGKVVAVTGATRALGPAIAERLAAEGCSLALWARDGAARRRRTGSTATS